jgi:hypothetical protein
MSVRLDGSIIRLEGRCYVEDAEPLLVLLQAEPGRVVDCFEAETLHTAVIQVLIALGAPVRGATRDDFLRRWVAPFFAKQRKEP